MVQSLLMALKRHNDDHCIDVIGPPWSAEIAARMPQVRNVIEADLAHNVLQFMHRVRIGRSLIGQYDQAIICPRSFKSAMIPYFAKIPQRTAYKGEMRFGIVNDMRPLDTKVTYKAVAKYVNLGNQNPSLVQAPNIQFPSLHVDTKKRRATAQRTGVSETLPSVALMPGAEFGPSKRWPSEYFGQIAARFKQDGYEVYIFGSPKDHAIGEEIVRASHGQAKNLCGQTTLEEAVDLLSLANVAITNDSGLMHIAAAVKRPVVVVYGSVTPRYTPPLSNHAEIKYLDLECSPCWKRQCPYGHYNCVHNLTVESVYRSAVKLLNQAAS